MSNKRVCIDGYYRDATDDELKEMERVSAEISDHERSIGDDNNDVVEINL